MKKLTKLFAALTALLTAGLLFSACNSELNQTVADATISSETEKNAPNPCTNFTAAPGNGYVTLSWNNPDAEDLYGVTVSCSSQSTTNMGSLSSPVTLISDVRDDVPTALKVNDLDNGQTYSFTIVAFDKNLNKSIAASTQGIPTTSTNTNEISDLKAVAGNQWVELSWKNEDFSGFAGFKIQIAGDDKSNTSVELPEDGSEIGDYLNNGIYEYKVLNLTNDISYSFTVRTILKNLNNQKIESSGKSVTETPNTGDSGIYSNSDLITYKHTLKAYEMGYHTSEYSEDLDFTSSAELDLSKTVISYDKISNRGKGSFEVGACTNIDDETSTVVRTGQKFRINVKYTPSSEASWDEADLLIGGTDGTSIRLIATNFKTPKDISSNELRLWLRADMISDAQLTDTGYVKRMPDASGNNFDAVCSDDSWEYAPKYVENADNGSDDSFNFFPYVDFSIDSKTQTSQLIVSASNDKPVLNTLDGSTALVVYKMMEQNGTYSIISANNGVSFPTTYSTYRGFSDLPKGETKDLDVKNVYGITVKALGMYGTNRWFSQTNELTKPNSFYRINDSITALCVRHDGAENLENRNADGSFNSNIRGFLNGEEKLLSYYYSLTAEARKITKMNNYEGDAAVTDATKQTSTSNITYYGAYGMPVSDAKGHRHGTLYQGNPVTFKNLWTAQEKQEKGETLSTDQQKYIDFWTKANLNTATDEKCEEGSRFCDWAYTIYPAANLTTTSKVNNSNSYFYMVNFIPRDIRKNGNISTFTLGPDFVSTSSTKARIAEVIFFAGPLSDEDLAAMNTYLKNKYNISD